VKLLQALEPPQADAVASAVSTLREVGLGSSNHVCRCCGNVYDYGYIAKDIYEDAKN